jgi:hypothetical protein
MRQDNEKQLKQKKGGKESILPTFYKRICANILESIKSLTFTANTQKPRAKFSYKKAMRM